MPDTTMSPQEEFLNMMTGGPWYDRIGYYQLAVEELAGKDRIDPNQWIGWPKPYWQPNGSLTFKGIFAPSSPPRDQWGRPMKRLGDRWIPLDQWQENGR